MINEIKFIINREEKQIQAWHNENMIGKITVPFIHFDWGHNTIIPMAGIGGVKTDSNYRRQGIANEMMKKAIDYSKENNFTVGGVSTVHRLPARRLYTKNDYIYLFTIYKYEKKIKEIETISLPEGITVRPFAAGDEKGIIDLWNRVYTDNGFFGGIKQDATEWYNMRKELLDNEPESIQVALLHNTIVGYTEYFYHWKNAVNCEIIVENNSDETGIIHGLLSNLENAMSKVGLKQLAFQPSSAHVEVINRLLGLGYNKRPAYVFQVALFNLKKTVTLLQPLFRKRLKNSRIKEWPHILRITMEDQIAEVNLSGGNRNKTIEVSGNYETIVRVLCGRKSAWEEYLRSHLTITGRIDEDTKTVLDALLGHYPMCHQLRDRW